MYIILSMVYTYPVGTQHKKKGRKLNTATDTKVKLPKTDCKWLNVNAQPVLLKVLLYLCSLHYIPNSENVNVSQ